MDWKDRAGVKALKDTRFALVRSLMVPAAGSMLITKLENDGHLTSDEVERIESGQTNAARVGKLIDFLSSRLTASVFADFIEAIGDPEIGNNPDLAQQLRDAYAPAGGVGQPRTQEVFSLVEPGIATEATAPAPRPISDVVDAAAEPEEQPRYEFACGRNATSSYLLLPGQRRLGRFNHKSRRVDAWIQLPDDAMQTVDEVHNFPDGCGGLIARSDSTLFHCQPAAGAVRPDGPTVPVHAFRQKSECSCDLVSGRPACMATLGGSIIIGTSEGALGVFQCAEEMELVQESHDNEAVLGLCANDGDDLLAAWRQGGLVEIGKVQHCYNRKYVHKFEGKVLTCAFCGRSGGRLAVVVRDVSGGTAMVVWDFSDGSDCLIAPLPELPDGPVQVAPLGEGVVLATLQFWLHLAAPEYRPTIQKWPDRGAVRWVRAVQHEKWLVAFDNCIDCVPIKV